MDDEKQHRDQRQMRRWSSSLPTPWLALYAIIFIIGGAYMAFIAVAEDTVARTACAVAATPAKTANAANFFKTGFIKVSLCCIKQAECYIFYVLDNLVVYPT